MPLDRKRVLITGAGSGIGRALAIEAAQRGMAVAICGRRRDALQETAEAFHRAPYPLIIEADVTDPEARLVLFERLAETWGALDILVNNAGIVTGGLLEQIDDAVLEQTFRTNVLAPIALSRDLMPMLVAAKPSRIVNIGSVFGDIPFPGFSAYSASKFALRGFSIALRRECRASGVAVTYAAPRATRTPAAAAFASLLARSNMKLDAPDVIARRIWDAVAAGETSVYAAGPERLFVLLQRLVPGLVDWALARQATN